MFEKNIFKKIFGKRNSDSADEEKQKLLDPRVNPWMVPYQGLDNPTYFNGEESGKKDEENKQTKK